jgi:hypothetical protein
MTQEQFDRANKLQNKIKYLKDKNNAFERVIDRLRENTQMQDIQFRLNDAWVATPIGTIDYGDLVNFLVQQRVKNETKIEKMQEEFEGI